MDTKVLNKRAVEAVTDYGVACYREGLVLGLDIARAFLSSIESKNAREACINQLKNEVKKAGLEDSVLSGNLG